MSVPLALADAALELERQDAELTDAYAQSASYREALQVALIYTAALKAENRLLEKRIRQMMGLEAWSDADAVES